MENDIENRLRENALIGRQNCKTINENVGDMFLPTEMGRIGVFVACAKTFLMGGAWGGELIPLTVKFTPFQDLNGDDDRRNELFLTCWYTTVCRAMPLTSI